MGVTVVPVIQGLNLVAGCGCPDCLGAHNAPIARVSCFVPIAVGVARNAPIVRVANGWGGGVEAKNNNPMCFLLTYGGQKKSGK
jgi:hypothetical protein